MMKVRRVLRSSLVSALLLSLNFGISQAAEVVGGVVAGRTHSSLLSVPESRTYLDAMLASIEQQIAKIKAIKKEPALVKSVNAAAGFKALCKGQGVSTVDGLMSSRRMTAAEFDACRNEVGDGIVEVKLGHDALALVVSVDTPAMDLSRQSLWRALGASKGTSWKQVGADLPDVAIKVRLPKTSVAARALLQSTVMVWGCEQPGQSTSADCGEIRTDGVIDQTEGNDASDMLVMLYSDWLANPKKNYRLVSVEGIAPNKRTVGSGLYPLGYSHYIYLKVANVRQVDETTLLLMESVSANAVMADGYLVGHGLIPLGEEEHGRVRGSAWRFDAMSSP